VNAQSSFLLPNFAATGGYQYEEENATLQSLDATSSLFLGRICGETIRAAFWTSVIRRIARDDQFLAAARNRTRCLGPVWCRVSELRLPFCKEETFGERRGCVFLR